LECSEYAGQCAFRPPLAPLIREWERQLRSENKSPKTIEVYLEAVWQLVAWCDHLPETPDESADSDAPEAGLARPAAPTDCRALDELCETLFRCIHLSVSIPLHSSTPRRRSAPITGHRFGGGCDKTGKLKMLVRDREISRCCARNCADHRVHV
jgi:hypothetical protein